MAKQRVELLGVKETQAVLAQVERDITLAGKPGKQAAVLVARQAASYGPDRTGDLSRSFKGLGGKRQGRVVSRAAHPGKQGQRVLYAPVIEYGWPKRGIAPQQRIMRALKANESTIRALYEDYIRGVLEAAKR
jgi:hypothetical protein